MESEKIGLKLNIQKTEIMASGPTTSWEIDGETVSDFILGGSKITADGDCSHEIRYTRVPHPEPPPKLLPPRTIPLGRPSAPAPSIQYHASNLDWRLVSYMILYMFQCYSPKS